MPSKRDDIKIIDGKIHCIMPDKHAGPREIPVDRDNCGIHGRPEPFEKEYRNNVDVLSRAEKAKTAQEYYEGGYLTNQKIHEKIIKEQTQPKS